MTDKDLKNTNERGADVDSTASAPNANTGGHPSSISAPPDSPLALGSIATSASRWCSPCQQLVIPSLKDPHRCPVCKKFIEANAANARDPDTVVARRFELEKKFERDFRPVTEAERANVRALAAIESDRERMRAGKREFTVLTQNFNAITDWLEQRATRERTPTEDPFEKLSREELIDKAEEIRAKLAEDLRCEAEQEVAAFEAEAAGVRRRVQEATASPEPEPEPQPTCQYCEQTIGDCVEMKSARLDVWRILHHRHPDEVERRREEATAEMTFMLGKSSPYR